jgi:hypothetical protein
LCQIITTFSSGISAINGLTSNNQYLVVGTSGTDFNINSALETHTFNLPSASETARGLVTINGQTFAGAKTFSTAPILSSLTASQLLALDASKNIQSLNGTGLVKLTTGTISYDTNSYVKTIVKDVVKKTVTGTVAQTIISSYLIPANTFVTNDFLKLTNLMFSHSGLGTWVVIVYINSSASLTGAVRIAGTSTQGPTVLFGQLQKSFALDGVNMRGAGFGFLSFTDIVPSTAAMGSTPYNLTQDKYIIVTVTPSLSADINSQEAIYITN